MLAFIKYGVYAVVAVMLFYFVQNILSDSSQRRMQQMASHMVQQMEETVQNTYENMVLQINQSVEQISSEGRNIIKQLN